MGPHTYCALTTNKYYYTFSSLVRAFCRTGKIWVSGFGPSEPAAASAAPYASSGPHLRAFEQVASQPA
eukprot:scaffold83154_cov64-Phaeocystis_antarctica.AAC.5